MNARLSKTSEAQQAVMKAVKRFQTRRNEEWHSKVQVINNRPDVRRERIEENLDAK